MFVAGRREMQSLAREAALGNASVEDLESRLRHIAEPNYVPESGVREAIIAGWEEAIERLLEDGGKLAAPEEARLLHYRSRHDLAPAELDQRGAFSRFLQGVVLREMDDNALTERLDRRLYPFNFQRTEKLVWVFPDTEYFEDKKRREYVGGSRGVSVRVAPGVYYRMGGHRGRSVESIETVLVGSGLMAVTTRHIYFSGGGRNFRVRHDRIVTIEPFSDGVIIHRDAATALPQAFKTGDGLFTYRLLMGVSRL